MNPYANAPIDLNTKRSRQRLSKRWVITIISLVIILLSIVMGLSYVVADKLVHPARKSILYTPKDAGIPYQDVTFNSREGDLKLNGWTMMADQPTNKWIILSHGYTGNRMIWPETDKGKAGLRLFQFLHNQGYNLLTFDYRNSGTSQGNTTTVGYFEKEDLLGAIDFIMSKNNQAQLALMGWSQGAASSLMAAPYAPSVKLVISDSTFANLKTYLATGLPHWSHLPNFPFTPIILNFWVPILTGIDNLSNVSPIDDAGNFKGGILLIHSKADGAIPVDNSIRIYNRYKGKENIHLKLFDNADHTLSFIKYPKEYQQVVLNFFKENQF